jgi:recombinational DNA repair ATPase RecF
MGMASWKEERLTKHFIKPLPGEYVPITVLEVDTVWVAWSVKEKRSVYLDMPVESEEFKRVRQVHRLKVLNLLSSRTSTIELSPEEYREFEKVYDEFIAHGGQIVFSRIKQNRRIFAHFEIWKKEESSTSIQSKTLYDKL